MNHFPTSTTPLLVFLVAACGDGTGPGDGCEPADLVLPATASGVLAISNVFVLPMDGTGLLEGQTVVVRGDRIERVGPAAQVVVPSEAVVIDGTCRLVMPGMADMHVHMGWKADAILLLANGVTTAREMWGSTAHLDFRNEILAGGHPGPSLSVGSAGIRSTEFMESIEILDPADAAGVVNRLADVGYDFIKVHEDIRSAVYDAVIAAADARGIAVAGHAGLNLTVTQVLGGSQTSIEHIATAFLSELRTTEGLVPVWFDPPLDQSSVDALASRLAVGGAWVTPTLVTLRKLFTPQEESEFSGLPEARYLARSRIQSWRDRGPWGPSSRRDGALEERNK
ncbi:MAG: hypothetical protein ACE5FJ_01180 [Gemmatimonadales bacterium]